MKKITMTLTFLLNFTLAFTQQKETVEYPEIGKALSDFVLSDIEGYSQSKVSLNTFRGKWLILDFWTRSCSYCIKNIPKMDSLQNEFKNDIQILLIGNSRIFKYDPPNYSDRTVYKNLIKERMKLSLPSAFDSVLVQKFGIGAFPYILILDKEGIVRGITHSISRPDIKLLLNGQIPTLPLHSSSIAVRKNIIKFESKKPLLIDGNGGPDTGFLYRSILSPWKTNMQKSNPGFSPNPNNWKHKDYYGLKNGIQILGETLASLYTVAYTGYYSTLSDFYNNEIYERYWWKPILEVKDSTIFQTDQFNKNLFCYSLIVPYEKANDAFLKIKMQRDLDDYFGFCSRLEKRIMPYWSITMTLEAKSKLKTLFPTDKSELRVSDSLKNVRLKYISRILAAKNPYAPPFIDETGINYNIDIYLPLSLGSGLHVIKDILSKQGIRLELKRKEMNVIVIRDNEPVKANSGQVL